MSDCQSKRETKDTFSYKSEFWLARIALKQSIHTPLATIIIIKARCWPYHSVDIQDWPITEIHRIHSLSVWVKRLTQFSRDHEWFISRWFLFSFACRWVGGEILPWWLIIPLSIGVTSGYQEIDHWIEIVLSSGFEGGRVRAERWWRRMRVITSRRGAKGRRDGDLEFPRNMMFCDNLTLPKPHLSIIHSFIPLDSYFHPLTLTQVYVSDRSNKSLHHTTLPFI